VEKLMVYNEIHRLRKEGFSNNAIARKLKISRFRVIEYGKMTPDEFYSFALSLQLSCRERKNIEKLMKWADFPEYIKMVKRHYYR
jgi:hypothetical protein